MLLSTVMPSTPSLAGLDGLDRSVFGGFFEHSTSWQTSMPTSCTESIVGGSLRVTSLISWSPMASAGLGDGGALGMASLERHSTGEFSTKPLGETEPTAGARSTLGEAATDTRPAPMPRSLAPIALRCCRRRSFSSISIFRNLPSNSACSSFKPDNSRALSRICLSLFLAARLRASCNSATTSCNDSTSAVRLCSRASCSAKRISWSSLLSSSANR
mmetsp:Transcript_25992/g.86568  ORF Transcript_25992/g.86568 Transcript_25992/m.86568 type:complete len:216 (+) Transcript_25992:428-1075(+)